jgi:hypothetical protein
MHLFNAFWFLAPGVTTPFFLFQNFHRAIVSHDANANVAPFHRDAYRDAQMAPCLSGYALGQHCGGYGLGSDET